MSCIHFANCIVTLADIYEYQGYVFEWHYFCGPTPVHRRTLDPRKTIPAGFWKMIDQWVKLSDKDREQHRYTGGKNHVP